MSFNFPKFLNNIRKLQLNTPPLPGPPKPRPLPAPEPEPVLPFPLPPVTRPGGLHALRQVPPAAAPPGKPKISPNDHLLYLARLAEKRKDEKLLAKLAKYSFEQWLYYANLIPVIFQFKYADNLENKIRGRVSRMSGSRQGVRNLVFVPSNKQPKSFNPDKRTCRYYDITRGNYRSFRPGNLVSITAFWSEDLGQFVDTPEAAGIEPGKPFQPRTKSTPATNGAREKRAAEREEKQRVKDLEREARKRNEARQRADRKAKSRMKLK